MQEDKNGAAAPETEPEPVPADPQQALATTNGEASAEAASEAPAVPAVSGNGGAGGPPAPPPETEVEQEDEEEGMLRMSFLEHLEELRRRLIRILLGIGIAFVASMVFANDLWNVIQQPALQALKELGYTPNLVIIRPMESFSIVWVKLPMLTSIFLASPWALYQVWAFIAPGLYKRERRWAAPFVVCSAGLFITGGLFAYFVVFRFGLTFLLGLGRGVGIQPMVTISEYFDLFVNVTLGVALVFELPVLIFFLTLLRIVTPSFLLRNSRYAILLIVAAAAIITPTPDIFNLMMFVVPMLVLFFVGVFASYLLVLHREERRFPWLRVLYVAGVLLFAGAGIVYLMVTKYGYTLLPHWPFLSR